MGFTNFGEAEEPIYEELTLRVGTAWYLEVPRVFYSTNNHDVCELLKNDNGTYSILMTKPGDTIISAMIPQEADKWIRLNYLIHIVEDNQVKEYLPYEVQAFSEEVLRLVNIERAKYKVRALRLSDDLQNSAAVRAEEITRNMSHTRPDGSKCFTAVINKGRTLGENIAGGCATPQKVVEQWMESPGHRQNILNKDFKELGVGYYYFPEGIYKHYWVQLFRG